MFSISFAVRQIFQLDPAEAMRKSIAAETNYKQRWYMRFVSYVQKVCLLCAMKNKRRMILSFVSTILAVALITFAFQYSDAGKYVLEHTYSERFLYDVQVFFEKGIAKEAADNMLSSAADMKAYELFSAQPVQIASDSVQVDTTLYGISSDSEMIHINDEEKNEIPMQTDGIVLSMRTARDLKVEQGDFVRVNDVLSEVSAIHHESIFFVQYCSQQVFEKVCTDEFHGAYVTLEEAQDYQNFYDSLQNKEGFDYLSKKVSQKKGIQNRLGKTDVAVYIMIVLAFIAGFLIIYNMSLINFKERVRVFSVMMAIGTEVSKISYATLLELALQYIVALVLGYALGTEAGKFLLEATSTDSIQYQEAFFVSSRLLIGVCVAGFMLAGHLLAIRNLKKIDIVEELKTRE